MDLNYLKTINFFNNYQGILKYIENKHAKIIAEINNLTEELSSHPGAKLKETKTNIGDIALEFEEANSLAETKKIVPKLDKEFSKICPPIEDEILNDISDGLSKFIRDIESKQEQFIMQADKLLSELEECPSGDGGGFESLTGAILDFLFTPFLEKGRRRLLSSSSDSREDLKPDFSFYFDDGSELSPIISKYYKEERKFWDKLFTTYQDNNGYLIIECKNVDKIGMGEVNQLLGYLASSDTNIGALVYKTQQGDRKARRHRYDILSKSKISIMMLLINEKLLKEMLQKRKENRVITGLLKRKAIDDRCFA